MGNLVGPLAQEEPPGRNPRGAFLCVFYTRFYTARKNPVFSKQIALYQWIINPIMAHPGIPWFFKGSGIFVDFIGFSENLAVLEFALSWYSDTYIFRNSTQNSTWVIA